MTRAMKRSTPRSSRFTPCSRIWAWMYSWTTVTNAPASSSRMRICWVFPCSSWWAARVWPRALWNVRIAAAAKRANCPPMQWLKLFLTGPPRFARGGRSSRPRGCTDEKQAFPFVLGVMQNMTHAVGGELLVLVEGALLAPLQQQNLNDVF
ncbi:hypothetical protein KM92DES2_20238 [uncultured Desulfovibrio sp.]|uniref:Uncharacterized protein n=1 Tax=uncultured Desulfovibrio sp. TaxID=167968 RepID=A0A212KJU3_9BACT|nr:hypothetical protein KM92DES2_20238 [uncultured Desulfovibrio sp.]